MPKIFVLHLLMCTRWVLHSEPSYLLQVPAVKPDSSLLMVLLRQVYWVQAMLAHPAHPL